MHPLKGRWKRAERPRREPPEGVQPVAGVPAERAPPVSSAGDAEIRRPTPRQPSAAYREHRRKA
jgi:hypothetical protein